MADAVEFKVNQAGITPFWRKLPFFFLFPFRFGPLVFLGCIVLASVLAGALLGTFGLLFKGLLLYLGLRYGINVLELFAKGRFEGHSVDHTLWGPEKRPAKLGLLIVLFIVLASVLGNVAVQSRLGSDTRAQDRVIESYKREHAAELARFRQEQEAFDKRYGLQAAAEPREAMPAEVDGAEGADAQPAAADPTAVASEPEQRPDPGPSRAEMLQASQPEPWEPLWVALLPAWYWLAMVSFSLLLPAAAIVIAQEDAFFKSLNPGNALYYLRVMGAAYFVLWLFFLLIAGTRQWVITLGENWSPLLRLPLELGLGTYLGLVLCALMGYTLYQFHQELHLDVDVDFDTYRQAGGADRIATLGNVHQALRKAAPADPLERKLQPLLAEGKVAEAIAEVKDEMRYVKLDPALNTRLHELYALQGDKAVTLAHGQQWLSALAQARRGPELLVALRKLKALDPAFKAADGAMVAPAAAAAMKQGDPQTAVRLVAGFDKRFPQHADTPEVLFLGARLLSEHQRQHDKSARLLRGLLTRYPEHAVAEEARTYLTVLERMPQAPPAGAA